MKNRGKIPQWGIYTGGITFSILNIVTEGGVSGGFQGAMIGGILGYIIGFIILVMVEFVDPSNLKDQSKTTNDDSFV